MAANDVTTTFRYLDLCAGIGGFHQAMDLLGGECVGASEIDEACIETYKANFANIPMFGDINSIDPKRINNFEVLCAGFPCQPFSKAGKRLGFADESRGKLFFQIMKIIDAHPEVEFVLLENVRNLADRPEYWNTIQEELKKRRFIVSTEPIILSPSDFGIPQIRERVFILGIRENLKDENKLPNSYIIEDDLGLEKKECAPDTALKVLDDNVDDSFFLDEERERVLLAWDEFRENTGIKIIGFPIWLCAMGIGIEKDSTFFESCQLTAMQKWKQNFYKKNRHFYQLHREYIDDWVERNKMDNATKLYRKFEWNCGLDVPDIKHGLIQVRQSGVRVKRPNYFPALVAMNNTPIIWDIKRQHFREITPHEASKLQSFKSDFIFCGSRKRQYKQLGNAVNVEIARQLGESLFNLRKAQ